MADRRTLRRWGRPHRGRGLRLHRGRLIDADDLHTVRADAPLIGDALRHPHPVTDRRGFAVARHFGARLDDEPRGRVGVHLGTRVKPGTHHELPAHFKPGAHLKPGTCFKPGAHLKPRASFKPSSHHKLPARNKPGACVGLSISHGDRVVDGSVIDPAGNAYVSPGNSRLPHGRP